VAATVDPLGGAFAVERLTADIEEAAEVYIGKIDDQGGAVAAIPFMQQEIHESAYRYQRDVEDKARIVVGVNEFVTDEGGQGELFQVDAGVGPALAERIGRFRGGRDPDAVGRALDALETGARGQENLVEKIIDAVDAAATLGEICDRLRGVFGTHHASVTF
jgi:methylmalonyl-CoA mutase N-terminal domain/subunit